jgi:hypothetical protein
MQSSEESAGVKGGYHLRSLQVVDWTIHASILLHRRPNAVRRLSLAMEAPESSILLEVPSFMFVIIVRR